MSGDTLSSVASTVVSLVPSKLQDQLPKCLGQLVCSYGRVSRCRDQKDFYHLKLRAGNTTTDVSVLLPKTLAIRPQLYSSLHYTGLVQKAPRSDDFEIHIQKVHHYGECPSHLVRIDPKMKPAGIRAQYGQRLFMRRYQTILELHTIIEDTLHKVSRDLGLLRVRTPFITFSDCEGAGETFALQTSIPNFFPKKAFLSVSAQLDEESITGALCCPTYTYGPSFRADPSDTSYHVCEYMHYEPEIPFITLTELMDWEETILARLADELLEQPLVVNKLDLVAPGVGVKTLRQLSDKNFVRVSYTDAIDILRARHEIEEFEVEPEWGRDLTKQHERFLAETHFGKPTFLHSFPSSFKSFYMLQHDPVTATVDGETVVRQTCASVDLLVPGIGELIGGGCREHRADVLESLMKEKGLRAENYAEYLRIRKEGGIRSGGFGLGFDRLIMYLLDLDSIRDVCAMPRYYKCQY